MSGPTNAYSQNAGTSPIQKAVIFASAPTSATINYDVGQVGIVSSTNSVYFLTSKSSSSGAITATWSLVSSGSAGSIDTITATDNSGVVSPVAGNVFIDGTGSIIATGSGNAISIGLVPLTNGQLLIGSTGADPVPAVLTSSGNTVTITNGPGTINLESVGGGALVINGDTGSITGNPITIFANTTVNDSGSSVSFANAGDTSQLFLTDSLDNVIIGRNSGNATISGAGNASLGVACLTSLSSGGFNLAASNNALANNTTGGENVALGHASMRFNVVGNFNTAVGGGSLQSNDGDNNSAFGTASLANLGTGSFNQAFGRFAGSNYGTNESSNLSLGSPGLAGESNVIRIGDQGSGDQQQNACFIAGITGVTTSNSNNVTLDTTTGQLGASASVSGTTVTATAGDITASNGNLVLGTAGNKILSTSVATTSAAGANSFGRVTLVAGTVTVSTAAVTTNSLIMIWRQSVGATGAAALGFLSVGTIINGTSFVINSLSSGASLAVTDVSVIGWMLVN